MDTMPILGVISLFTLITALRWALSVTAFHEKTGRVLLWYH